jgi:hypothetical protein
MPASTKLSSGAAAEPPAAASSTPAASREASTISAPAASTEQSSGQPMDTTTAHAIDVKKLLAAARQAKATYAAGGQLPSALWRASPAGSRSAVKTFVLSVKVRCYAAGLRIRQCWLRIYNSC